MMIPHLTGAHSTGAKKCADRAGAHSASADPTGADSTCANFGVCSPKISTSRDISPVSPTFCISVRRTEPKLSVV